ALRESEIRFSRAFYANPACMTISSFPDGRLSYVNDAFVSLSGYSREEVIGQPPTMLFVDPNQWSGLLDRLAHGAVREIELQARKKSGEICDVILSLEPIDVLGERGVLAIGMDITARKRAEEELRQAGEQIRKVIDAIPVQLWSGPADGGND